MPHNLTQTVISEHLADGTMTVGDEIALRIDLPPLQDVLRPPRQPPDAGEEGTASSSYLRILVAQSM